MLNYSHVVAVIMLLVTTPQADAQASTGPPEFRMHEVKNINAKSVVELLHAVYKDDPAVRFLDAGNQRVFVHATPAVHAEIAAILRVFDARQPKAGPMPNGEPVVARITKTIPLAIVDPEWMSNYLRDKGFLSEGGIITVDYQIRAIIVTGTEDAVKNVSDAIRMLDQGPRKKDGPSKQSEAVPPQKSSGGGDATLQIYPVPDGTAEAVAKLLQEAYPPPQTRITPSGKDRIVVFANEKTHAELAKQRLLTLPTTAMDVVPLGARDAVKMAATLQKIMGAAVGKRLAIVAEPDKNSIILRGDADLIVEAKKLLALLGNEPNREGVRVLRVEKAGAATVADALYLLLAKLRPDNDIHLVLPGSPEPIEQKKKEPAKKDAKSAKKREPVTITALGDRLMIATADREVMDLIIHVTRILITTDVGGCDFEIIRFKHAKATHVAQVLDGAFNHPTSPNFGGFRFGGGFGGGGGGGRASGGGGEDASTKNERVRVVADPVTNTLLMRATPLDAMVIRRLITEALDMPEAAEKRGLKEDRKKD